MEVHHHPQIEKENFKEYFLEFLMIFLAVTLGFIAENVREHFVDRDKEKEYMKSLSGDLHNDIIKINETIKGNYANIARADSLLLLFEKGDFINTSSSMYYLGRLISLKNLFEPSDGTTQQLNHAGGLRLIQNRLVVDSIQHYINSLRDFSQLVEIEDQELADYRRSLSRIFSALVFNNMISKNSKARIQRINYNPPLVSYDKMEINNLLMNTLIVKFNRIKQIDYMERILFSASSLIRLIEKEYHMENE